MKNSDLIREVAAIIAAALPIAQAKAAAGDAEYTPVGDVDRYGDYGNNITANGVEFVGCEMEWAYGEETHDRKSTLVTWEEMAHPEAAIKTYKDKEAATRRAAQESSMQSKREMLERLKRELGE